MAKNIQDYRDKVKLLIRDNAEILKQAGIDDAIRSSIDQYNIDKPHEKIDDITGDGTYDYDIVSEFSDWSEGFSQILRVEFPAGTSQDPDDDLLDDTEWLIYDPGTGTKYLRFKDETPTSAQTIRVTYTIPHVLDDTAANTTIPASMPTRQAVETSGSRKIGRRTAAQTTRNGSNPFRRLLK